MNAVTTAPRPVSMSSAQAKKLAVLAPLTAATLAFVASLTTTGSLPDLRVLFGAGVAMVLLSLFAEVNPSLAGGFALLLLVTASFVTGGEAWKGLARIVGSGGSSGGVRHPVAPAAQGTSPYAGASASGSASTTNNPYAGASASGAAPRN